MTYTGPSNAECYFTTLHLEPIEVIHYTYGSGSVDSEAYNDPTNTEATAKGDHLYCGGYTISVTDLSGAPVPEVVLTDDPDASWRFSYDGSSLTPSSQGSVLNLKVQFSLVDFPEVSPVEVDLLIQVLCPSDGSLIEPATITIISEMPQTSLTYDVTTLVSLEADLATYQVS